MFNFDKLASYGQWQVVSTDRVSASDAAKIEKAEVTYKEFEDGSTKVSVEISLKNGCVKYLGLSKDSNLSVGDSVDMTKGTITTLKKDGKTIYRFCED